MIIHLFNSSSVSGPERLVLPALASAGGDFLVVNLREERLDHIREADPLEDYARSLNLNYRDVLVCGRWDSLAVRHLTHLIGQLNPDLVHAHDVKASAYLLQARSARLKNRCPIVSTHHGIHGRPDWKTRLYEAIYRRYLLKFFDRTLCVSTPDYQSLLQSGVPSQRLRLHLNGIDGHRMDPLQRAAEAQRIRAAWFPEKPLARHPLYFGVVGRLSAEKDHARLLQVLGELNRFAHMPDWKCLIFGNGALEKSLQESARRAGLEKRLVWMGYRKNAGAELAGLDLLLSFSKAEGLPINLIEAGWAGTPIMATQVGGVIDLIPDHRFGILIDPQESPTESARRLNQAFSTENGRAGLKKQALLFQQRVAAEFTQEVWMRRLKSLYGELGVGLENATAKPAHPLPEETGSLAERVKSVFFTRLMLYPTGRMGAMRQWNRHGFRILMYHRFSADDSSELQDSLSRQCAHLTSRYTLVSLTEIARSLSGGPPLPPNALTVTVDDGYRDFRRNAYPVFRAHNIPMTVFLVSGFVDHKIWLWWDQIRYSLEHTQTRFFRLTLYPGQPPTSFTLETWEQRQEAAMLLIEAAKKVDNNLRLSLLQRLAELLAVELPAIPPPAMAPMDWAEIQFLAANNVEFGAHTQTHPILSRLQDPAELTAEIGHSKKRIEDMLQRPVQHFCYPNGQREDVHPLSYKILEQNRFQTAVTAERGVNFRGVHPFWLRRIGVDPLMSRFNFEALLAGVGGSRSKSAPFSMASR